MTNGEDPRELVTDCVNRQSKMTDWEVDFIASISDQLDAGRDLSERQMEILERIWEKVT